MSSRFWSSVASVLSGTAVAQAIPIVGSLLLARLFVPEAYGGYAVWLGAVLIVAVTLTLRLEMVLAVIPDGEEREKALGLVLATVLASGLIVAALAMPAWLLGIMPSDIASPLLIGTAILAAIFAAWSDTWQAMAAADGSYRLLIKLRISQAALILGSQLVASLMGRSGAALVGGHLAGLVLAVALAALMRRAHLLQLRGLPTALVAFWRNHPRFPMFALPADSINALSAQLPLLVVSARFGNEAAGVLALTMRVLGAPISLLGRALLDVFRRHAAEAFRLRGDCRTEHISTLRVLAAGSAVFIVMTILFAEPIFAVAFGDAWRRAGTMAIWLAPMFALRFMASPLSYVFYIVGKQHVDLMWQVCLFMVITTALFVPDELRHTVIAYGYGYSAMYLIYLGLSYKFSRGSAP